MAIAQPILTASTVAFVAMLAILDFRTHRIPNRLTVPAALAGLLMNIAVAGLAGALRSGVGFVVGLSIFLPLFFAGQFGAGDVKGVAAVGAFVGPYGVIVTAIFALISGMLGGLVVLFVNGGYPAVRSMFARWMFRAYVLCTTGRRANLEVSTDDPARRRFPYGFAIACGTAASLILRLTK